MNTITNDLELYAIKGNVAGGKILLFNRLEKTLTKDEIKKIILKSNNKQSSLDPLPTTVVKSCIDELLPIIHFTINDSLMTGIFPTSFNTLLLPL